MKLTPLDIHHKEFRRSIRGYNEEEVDAFLDEVTTEFERFFKENAELKEQVEGMQGKVKKYEGVEESLQKALLTGQRAADQVKDDAGKESKIIIGDAEKKAKEIIQNVQDEKKKIVAELQRLTELEDKFRAGLQEVLNDFLEKSADFKLVELPSEVQEQVDPVQVKVVEEVEPDTTVAEPAVPVKPQEPAARIPSEPTDFSARQPVVPKTPEAPAETPEAPAETPGETFTDTTLAATDDKQFGAIGAPAADDSASNFFAPAPQEQEANSQEQEAKEDGSDQEEQDMSGDGPQAPARGSGAGYFDDTGNDADVVNDSPQEPDIGAPKDSFGGSPAASAPRPAQTPAGDVATPSAEPEFKVTLGAPEHDRSDRDDSSAGSQSADPGQTDVITDLKSQEVPEFDPAGNAEENASKKSEQEPDVVSSFFDDDLGGD